MLRGRSCGGGMNLTCQMPSHERCETVPCFCLLARPQAVRVILCSTTQGKKKNGVKREFRGRRILRPCRFNGGGGGSPWDLLKTFVGKKGVGRKLSGVAIA